SLHRSPARLAELEALVPRRPFHVEASPRGLPGNSLAELGDGRVERAGQLEQGAEARFAARPLQQRDLGPGEPTAVSQLFLGDARVCTGLTEVGGEALLGGHGRRFLGADDRNSTDNEFPKVFAQLSASATLQCSAVFRSRNFYAESVERLHPMCYTPATNGRA